MILSPSPVQQFFGNNGRPLDGGLLFTYVAGTTTKIATYTDDTGNTQNTNPIVLDFRGECNLWLDPLLTYKFVLAPRNDTDPPTNPIWTVDNVSGLGGLTQQIIGQLLWPRTAAEIAANITPVNYAYQPYWVPRYGTNTTPGITDMTAAIQAAIDAGAQAGVPGYLPGFIGRCLTTAVLEITESSSGLVGDGSGFSKIVTAGAGSPPGNNAISVADGLQFVHVSGLSIANGTRWTDTPHSYIGLEINGTSVSPVFFSRFDDLFLDGYEANLIANGVSQCFFTRIDSENCNRGFVSEAKSFNCFIDNSAFVGEIGTSLAGIVIGDGASAAEGWVISDSLIYGFDRGVWGFGSNNSRVSNCIIDFFGEYGVLLQSDTNAATNWSITGNYMAATGSASAGVRLLSSTASSDPRGTSIGDNDILVYGGSSLTYGILIDGTNEQGNIITENRVGATSGGGGFDLKMDVGANSIVTSNRWRANGASLATGVDPVYQNNLGLVTGNLGSVASAATIALPFGPDVVVITGTTNISTITATGHSGRTVKLFFTGALTVTDGSNLALNGNFVTTSDDTLTLVCIGTTWFEIARSAN